MFPDDPDLGIQWFARAYNPGYTFSIDTPTKCLRIAVLMLLLAAKGCVDELGSLAASDIAAQVMAAAAALLCSSHVSVLYNAAANYLLTQPSQQLFFFFPFILYFGHKILT